MHPSTLTEALLDGPAGTIEVAINDPGTSRRGLALIAHPHPLQGGTRDNKVVTTLARALFSLGYCVWRPNFRGVGRSAGVYAEGRGEADDLVRLAEHMLERHGEQAILLAGFSFGAFVQTQVARRVRAERLALVAPAVNRFDAEPVAADTLVVHGDQDAVVPLAAVLAWAQPQSLPIVVIPGGEHFFHGRLTQLQRIVVHWCRGHRGGAASTQG
ncbi:MAG: alpha/beta hydrolase [Burkholderiales bacterium]|nr:alpha/beta hydrolase [Burkholderiales bacterium]